MKLFYMFLFVFVSGFAQSQDSTIVKSYSSALGIGEEIEFGDNSIRFKQLVSDSRCPSDVTCIWAGEAKILIEVFKNGKSLGEEVFVIAGGGQGSLSLNNTFLGELFTLSGLHLKPYPTTSVKLKPSDYILNLEVRKTAGD